MYALITGASSGIGKDMAYLLSKRGYKLILVARNEKKLNAIAKKLKTEVVVMPMDLSVRENCFELFEKTKDYDIEILVNNAGFGVFGSFDTTDLETELNMIDLNIVCLHILTKLYLQKFTAEDKGYIMNVASLAGFGAGPLLAAYYASKGYVLKLTEAINHELLEKGSNVHICALCPGPVDTGFNDRAGVKFSMKPMKSIQVARYALRQMFNKKMIILPGMTAKLSAFMCKTAPIRPVLKACYTIQKKKGD